jgi:hypothetical protein
MKVKFNTITWYSRMLSYIFIFGVFPIIIFNIGVRYHQTVEVLSFGYVAASATYLDGSYDKKSFQDADSYAARKTVEGEWQSTDDAGDIMVIKPDNMFYEKKDGQITSSGTWKVRESLAGTDYAHLPTGMYMQKTSLTSEGEEENGYYEILLLNGQHLDMKSLDTDRTLSFSKMEKKR